MILVVLIFRIRFLHFTYPLGAGSKANRALTEPVKSWVLTPDDRIKVMIRPPYWPLSATAYLQNIGMFDVYTAHLNTGLFPAQLY